jgi:hydrogenase nickel incorporation protein HypA/HybF
MHELSLAQSIVNIVKEHVPSRRIAAVRTVRVDLGQLSGVLAESLDFCFTAIVTGTELKDARLELNRIRLRVACEDCQDAFDSTEDTFLCPVCHGHRTTVVSGLELLVKEIELADNLEKSR